MRVRLCVYLRVPTVLCQCVCMGPCPFLYLIAELTYLVRVLESHYSYVISPLTLLGYWVKLLMELKRFRCY